MAQPGLKLACLRIMKQHACPLRVASSECLPPAACLQELHEALSKSL